MEHAPDGDSSSKGDDRRPAPTVDRQVQGLAAARLAIRDAGSVDRSVDADERRAAGGDRAVVGNRLVAGGIIDD